MKIFSVITKQGRVDFPIKDAELKQAESIMKNPLGEVTDKLREMNDLSNKLTKSQIDELATRTEKLEFTDVDGKKITLLNKKLFTKDELKDAGQEKDSNTNEWKAQPPVNPEPAKKPAPKDEFADHKKVATEYAKTAVPMKHQEAAKTYIASDQFKDDVARHSDVRDKEIKDLGYPQGPHAAIRAVNEHLHPIMSKADYVEFLRKTAWNMEKGGPGSGRIAEGGSSTEEKEPEEYVGTNDKDTARELHTHATQDGNLYRSQVAPTRQSMQRKFDNGTYDHDKAKIAWGHVADNAAQDYNKQYGSADSKWHEQFKPDVRHAVASEMADHWKNEMEAGNRQEYAKKSVDCLRDLAGKLTKGGPGSGRTPEGGSQDHYYPQDNSSKYPVVHSEDGDRTSSYKVHPASGTHYPADMHDDLVDKLEQHKADGTRLKFEYGDSKTGQSYGDMESGHLGRSTGEHKIPLIIHNSRSSGGPALSGVVKVSHADSSKGGTVWQHPNYKAPKSFNVINKDDESDDLAKGGPGSGRTSEGGPLETQRESQASEYNRFSVPVKNREAVKGYIGTDQFHNDVAGHEADAAKEIKDKGLIQGKQPVARAIDNFIANKK